MNFYFVQVFSGQIRGSDVLPQIPFSIPFFQKKKSHDKALKFSQFVKKWLGWGFFVEVVFLNTVSLRQKMAHFNFVSTHYVRQVNQITV